MSVIQIPQTDSIEELAQFWDSHSVTDFEDQLEEVTEPVFDRESLLTIYVPSLVLAPQPEGGFTVTSPLLPELITEGDSVEEALENTRDALAAVVEAYQDAGRSLPVGIRQPSAH